MGTKTEITPDDILAPDAYEAVRASKRSEMVGKKKNRRLHVGPDATFYFENFDTILYQIQEMLRVEKGGGAQLADELEAYNPLVPNGQELVATVMFEIDDPDRRAQLLGVLGGVEEMMTIDLGDDVITSDPESDVDRTNAAGKASSVQFVHFKFTADQIQKFCAPDARVLVGINHPQYGHMTVVPEEIRAALAGDFHK
ncbi:MAG: DUF3501 family protein [Rhodospirillales bacterium]|nr:DUF3501 family protein [Rhodospirillales bacterium]